MTRLASLAAVIDLDLYALFALCSFRCGECRGNPPAYLMVRGTDGAPDRMLCGDVSAAVIREREAPP